MRISGIIGTAESEARNTTVNPVCTTTRSSSFISLLARQKYLALSGILWADLTE